MKFPRSVILGGGDILDYASVASRVEPGDYVICADGGYRHCGRLGVSPDLLVGDFDSIGEALPAGIPAVTHPAEKDYTDCALAAEEAVRLGSAALLFAGMTGGPRMDHTLANWQTLAGLSRRGIRVSMFDGVTETLVHTAPVQGKEVVLPYRKGCYFSLFSLSGVCRRVTIRGGRYPLAGYDLRFDEARAVSNEFLAGDVAVAFEAGTMILFTTPIV